jgi:hypothetical protein
MGADQPPDGAEGRDCPRADRAGWLPGAVAAAGRRQPGLLTTSLELTDPAAERRIAGGAERWVADG